jgi:putative ABC transport system permease protein
MAIVFISFRSLMHRKLPTLLLILSIACSVLFIVGIQKLKTGAKQGFSRSISGTDLIVGSRSGDMQLLMTTVFRVGTPMANMSWNSFEGIQALPQVQWAVPVSSGDGYKGYPVLATLPTYFKHINVGRKQSLTFQIGRAFGGGYELVLGQNVARALGLKLSDTLQISHGRFDQSSRVHDNHSFEVVGILNTTHSPIDNTVFISLEASSAVHSPHQHSAHGMPKSITGAFIGLTSKTAIFLVQQRIANWPNESLMAILPGVTLSKLWRSLSPLDAAFMVVGIGVGFMAGIGLLLGLFMSLRERSRELTIYRVLGAHPLQCASMLVIESVITTVLGIGTGLAVLQLVKSPLIQLIENRFGVVVPFDLLMVDALLFASIVIVGVCISIVPAVVVARMSRSAGVTSL